jgi:YD repeat-containing protein
MVNANNQQTNFTYNPLNQMTAVSDALNQQYVFNYDALGRVLNQTKAGSTMSYSYDLVGNQTQRTDYKGVTTNYVYDNLNRLKNINI